MMGVKTQFRALENQKKGPQRPFLFYIMYYNK
jgi:hypothetical protein